MKIKWLTILLAVTLLSGCQLAQEDTVTSDVEDHLIGLFVTKDGRAYLEVKREQWRLFSSKVDTVIGAAPCTL